MGGLHDFFVHISPLEYYLPSDPCPVGVGKFLPNLVSLGETVVTQHGVGQEEESSRVRDQVPLSVGLLLGIFKFVYVIKDYLHILMVRLHLVLGIQNVCGMEAHTHGL